MPQKKIDKGKLTLPTLSEGSGTAVISALRRGQRSVPVAEPFCAGKEGDGDMYGCDVHREKADESRGQSHGSQREMGTHVQS